MFDETGGYTPKSTDVDAELKEYKRAGNHWLRYTFANSVLSGPSLLDVGCGSGLGILALRSQFTRVVGIDMNPGAVEWAARHVCPVRPGSRFIVAGPDDDIGAGNQFDAVIAFEVLEHVPDPGRFLSSLGRHLRPSGSILLSTPNGFYSSHRPSLYRTRYHVDEYSLRELVEMIPPSLELMTAYAEFRVDSMDVALLRARQWSADRHRIPKPKERSLPSSRLSPSMSSKLYDEIYRHANGSAFWLIKELRRPLIQEAGYSTLVVRLRRRLN